MSTTFHPQVYRGITQQQPSTTTTTTTASTPSCSSSSSNSSKASPRTTTCTPTPTPVHPSCSRSINNNDTPWHGLQHDPSLFPLHPSLPAELQVRLITAAQYASMVEEHARFKMGEGVLFPWLHGADVPGSQQAANFGYVNGNRAPTPRFRGLTTVRAPASTSPTSSSAGMMNLQGLSRTSTSSSFASSTTSSSSTSDDPGTGTGAGAHERHPTSASIATSFSTDSFSSACTASSSASSVTSSASVSGSTAPGSPSSTRSSATSLSSAAGVSENIKALSCSPSPSSSQNGPEPVAYLLNNALLPSDLLVPHVHPARLLKPVLPPGISFRHFRLQAPKYASVSDVVVYAPDGGLGREAADVARRCAEALQVCREERVGNGEREDELLRYSVFVVLEPFAAFEKEHPHLVAVDSRAWAHGKVDFAEREHEEMRKFTKATEIAENVWIGNTFDVPWSEDVLSSPRHDNSSPSFESSPASSRRNSAQPSESSTSYEGPLHNYEADADADDGHEDDDNEEDPFAADRGKRNPMRFSVCIEARDTAYMANTAELRERAKYLDEMERRRVAEHKLRAEEEEARKSARRAQAQMQMHRMRGQGQQSSSYWYNSSSSEEESSGLESVENTDDEVDEHEANDDDSDFGEFREVDEEEESDKENFEDAHEQQQKQHSWRLGGQFKVSKSLSVARKNNRRQQQQQQRLRRAAKQQQHQPSSTMSTPTKKRSHSSATATATATSLSAPPPAFPSFSAAAASSKEQDTKDAPPTVLELCPDEVLHLEAFATAQSVAHPSGQQMMLDAILEHVIWIRAQARPTLRTSIEQRGGNPRVGSASASASTLARRVLIHCSDGYTDSSVLALAYIMYDRVLSLPQAYLHLQLEKKRSFFVYPSDVPLLGALEKRIMGIARAQGRSKYNDDLSASQIAEIEKKEKEAAAAAAAQAAARAAYPASAAPPSSSSGSGALASTRSLLSRPGLFSRSSSATSSSTVSSIRSPTPTASAYSRSSSSPTSSAFSGSGATAGPSNAVANAWFYSDKFDGHFPSRILDHVYLGNLNHACNALMLKKLGITHVLSIGESALIPPAKQAAPPVHFSSSSSASLASSSSTCAARARTPTNSLWLEQSLGNIEVLDIQDIQDDGVDPILPHLVSAIEFIDVAHAKGGKVLVHCRVGVSRSATLVIAYAMKHLDLSLADAYLLVRARRLNILIQPTVLFMWTLHMYEEEIRESAFDDKSGKIAKARTGRIAWPNLATELANLNAKYLGV